MILRLSETVSAELTSFRGDIKLNGSSVGTVKRAAWKRGGQPVWLVSHDRLHCPYAPVHSRPSVLERWNRADVEMSSRDGAVQLVAANAGAIAREFPVRYRLR